MYRTTTTQDARADLSATQQPNRKLDAHRIAALFAVLALGLLFDDDSSTIVHHLRQDKAICLFNAASSLLTLPENHFLPSPSIAAVETLHNQVSCKCFISSSTIASSTRDETVCFCVGLEQASKSGWTLLGLALRVAQAIGLQRDPIRLGLVGEAAEHRRRVWWEVSTYEMLQSLNFGRPNSLPYVVPSKILVISSDQHYPVALSIVRCQTHKVCFRQRTDLGWHSTSSNTSWGFFLARCLQPSLLPIFLSMILSLCLMRSWYVCPPRCLSCSLNLFPEGG